MIPSAPPALAPGFHAVPAGHLAAIVTALDMREKLQRVARPLPAGFDLVRSEKPDLAWYRALFAAIGAPWLWTSRLRLSPQKLGEILAAPTTDIHVVRDQGAGGQPVGLVELDFAQSEQCEIAFFGLLDTYRRRGLGRPMMDFALARAWSNPAIKRVWIHTCSLDDPAALGFYQSCGFVPYERQVEILPDPRLQCILPRESAPDQPIL